MPPNLFKNTSTGLWTDVGTEGAVWRFDRYGVTPIYMDCTFQTYDESYQVFTGTFTENLPLTGDIVITFENYAGDVQLFTGSHVDVSTSGDIDCAFEEMGFFSQAGLHLGCEFEKWEYLSVFNIEGEDMDNCVFKEWKCEMIGSSDYIYMTCEFHEFEGEMFDSPGLDLATEQWEFSGTGTNGVMAQLDLTLRAFDGVLTGGVGNELDLEFEKLEFDGTSDTEIKASMDLVFKLIQGEMDGNSDIVGSLDLQFLPFYATLGADDFIDPRGSLDLTFVPFRSDMAGIKGLEGGLTGNSMFMNIRMTGYTDGPNALELVFENPKITLGLEEEDCDLADTLTYTR